MKQLLRSWKAVLFALAGATGICPSLSAQQASVAPYGEGCTFVGSTSGPDFGFPAPPRLGSEFEIRYLGPLPVGGTRPWLTLGVDPIDILIPETLFPFQPPNCRVLLVPWVVYPIPPASPTVPSYPDRLTVSIPSEPSLAGLQIRLQWWLLNDNWQGTQFRRAVLTSRGWIATLGS